MAGRRRRRRPTVNWLPVLGVQPDPNNPNDKINGFTFAIVVSRTNLGAAANGGQITAIQALTFDIPGEQRLELNLANTIIPSLRDYVQGSAYRLRRIVGKCWATMDFTSPTQGLTKPPACLFAAGFIVLKVDPVSGAPLDSNPQNYGLLQADNISDPWIWRRVWLFGQNGAGDNSAVDRSFSKLSGGNIGAAVNGGYGGGVADGPHIDQKTARVIGPDERLFFVISTKAIPLTTEYDEDGLVVGYLDYRLLGTFMNKIASNRRHSSR